MNSAKTRNKYLAPGIAIAVIALLGVSLVYFRHNSPYGFRDTLLGTPKFVLRLTDVEMVGRSGGKPIWSLKSKHVDVSQTRIRTDFESITDGKLYDGDRIAATLTAGRGSYDSISGDVRVSGGANITSREGYGVSVDSASWSAYFKRLVCPGKVKMTAKDSRIEGQDLVADMREGVVTVEKPKMTVSVSEVPDVVPVLGGRK